jgi:hypothetical protein
MVKEALVYALALISTVCCVAGPELVAKNGCGIILSAGSVETLESAMRLVWEDAELRSVMEKTPRGEHELHHRTNSAYARSGTKSWRWSRGQVNRPHGGVLGWSGSPPTDCGAVTAGRVMPRASRPLHPRPERGSALAFVSLTWTMSSDPFNMADFYVISSWLVVRSRLQSAASGFLPESWSRSHAASSYIG